jgi:hypothetical protein
MWAGSLYGNRQSLARLAKLEGVCKWDRIVVWGGAMRENEDSDAHRKKPKVM